MSELASVADRLIPLNAPQRSFFSTPREVWYVHNDLQI